MDAAELIIDAREKRGWSQQMLGDHVGVDQATISRWERRKSKPRGPALRILAALKDLSEDATEDAE